MKIIGITGTIGAGKGTVVAHLQEKGFTHFSVRDFLREELTRRGLEHNRDNMLGLANELRKDFGPAYIMEELYKKAQVHGGNGVIESIRNIGEVEYLKSKPDFLLIAVDADRKIRYDRILLRGSSTDAISYEKFCEQEDTESTGTDPWALNLPACIALSDAVFQNNETIPELYEQVDAYLDKIGNK